MTEQTREAWVLGKEADVPASPDEAQIATIEIVQQFGVQQYSVRLSCPEFTSLCPVTGQPDFAHIVIDYVPQGKLVESKSLKLFMQSFRNHGAFHEQCTVKIGAMLALALNPLWIRVSAFWYPRGGIPIDVFWQTGPLPDHIHLPPIDIPTYRAR